MPTKIKALIKRWLSQRHFFAGVAIPCFAVFIMLIGGCRNIDIIMHEAHTTATVTGLSGSHGVILYRYVVERRAYTGSGDPGNPPYPVGSTFEIMYSTWHPSFSSAQDPFIIFGQFFVGCLFLLWADYMATHYGKKRTASLSPGP